MLVCHGSINDTKGLKSTYYEIQGGGLPPNFKSLNRCNSAMESPISLQSGMEFDLMTPDIIQTFKVKRWKVKITAWHNDSKNLLNCQKLKKLRIAKFRSVWYCLSSCDTWSTTDIQGQVVKGQGYSMQANIVWSPNQCSLLWNCGHWV